jgi:hypothetical protein
VAVSVVPFVHVVRRGRRSNPSTSADPTGEPRRVNSEMQSIPGMFAFLVKNVARGIFSCILHCILVVYIYYAGTISVYGLVVTIEYPLVFALLP